MKTLGGQDEISRVANGVINGDIALVKGCRLLTRLIDWNEEAERATLEIILIVDSETEDYPLDEDEHLWLPESFASKRARAAHYIEEVRGDVLEACRLLLRRQSRRTSTPNQGDREE